MDVAAGVIVNTTNQVCIAKRPNHVPQGGVWEFPGGKRRIGESLDQTAIREVGEEICVELGPGLPLGVVCGEVKGREYELHVFEHGCDTDPLLGSDHDDGRWLEPSQLFDVPWLQLDVPLVRALKEEVRALKEE